MTSSIASGVLSSVHVIVKDVEDSSAAKFNVFCTVALVIRLLPVVMSISSDVLYQYLNEGQVIDVGQ